MNLSDSPPVLDHARSHFHRNFCDLRAAALEVAVWLHHVVVDVFLYDHFPCGTLCILRTDSASGEFSMTFFITLYCSLQLPVTLIG